MGLSYTKLEEYYKEACKKRDECLKGYAELCHRIEILETEIQELKDEIQKGK